MITIIDYGAGNIQSVTNALEYMGAHYQVSHNEQDILRADHVILPGVGAYGSAMKKLEESGLIACIQEVVLQGIPFLGICLGMQLLFDSSEEAPNVSGLGILKGRILHFPTDMGLKIPHIGWNSMERFRDGRLYRGFEYDPYVYYVHSYYLQAEDPTIVTGISEYGINIHASIEYKNVFGCQFHPEKSGDEGLRILRNFILTT